MVRSKVGAGKLFPVSRLLWSVGGRGVANWTEREVCLKFGIPFSKGSLSAFKGPVLIFLLHTPSNAHAQRET